MVLSSIAISWVHFFLNCRQNLSTIHHLILCVCLTGLTASNITSEVLLLHNWILCLLRNFKELNQIRNTIFIFRLTNTFDTCLNRMTMFVWVNMLLVSIENVNATIVFKQLLTQWELLILDILKEIGFLLFWVKFIFLTVLVIRWR